MSNSACAPEHKQYFLLSPLQVNAAVETCRGADRFALSKQFRSYFNFSNPLIAEHFAPETCAWAFGLNVLDLKQWRKSNITETYHDWQKQVRGRF
jgi:hypothetical protein